MSDQPIASSQHPILSGLARLWWVPLIRGIMLVILGVYALFRPGMTVATFAQVFGFFLAFDGVIAIIAGITGQVPSRGWTIARGVFCLIAGAFIFANPMFVSLFTAVTFIFVLGFSSIASGVIEIFAAIRDRKEIEGEGWLILGGVISVIFGLVLLSQPLTSAALFVRIIGVFAVIGGIASVIFAFRIRSLGKKLERHDAERDAEQSADEGQ